MGHTARRATSASLLYGAAAFLALVAAAVGLRAWEGSLSVPLAYDGDALQFLAWLKGIHEHGWLLENPSLGAPFGMLLYDFPEGGSINLLPLPLLASLTGSWVVAFNLLHLLTFPLAAVAALWAMRRLGVVGPLAVALSVLYAVAPYHLDRGLQHYLLSFYWGLPPILSYALTIAGGRRPVTRLRRGLSRRWLRRSLPAVLAAALVGLMQVYYVAFAAMLTLAAGLFGWIRSRRPAVLSGALLLCVVIALAAMAQYSPSLAYRAANGINRDVANRGVGEAEYFPLKPADLVLPVSGHVLRPLAELRQQYEAIGTYAVDRNALGVVGTAGLIAALGALVVSAAARRRGALTRRLSPYGWLAAGSIALAMFGGGSTLFSLFIGPSLRAWDRLAIAVAFIALAALGVLLSRLVVRAARPLRRPLLLLVAAGLLTIGVVDQAATVTWRPDFEGTAERWRSDRAFFEQVEASVPAGGLVYQLPYLPWPERTRDGIVSNEQLRPYLHSRTLRWSGGLMAGRNPGWLAIVNGSDAEAAVATLGQLGAVAVLVDRRMSARADVGAMLGEPMLVDADGTFELYPLELGDGTGLTERSAPNADLVDPIWLRWAAGFEVLSVVEGRIVHPASSSARVELRSDRVVSRQAVIQLTLLPAHDQPQAVTISWPDGLEERLTVGAGPLTHRRTLELQPGASTVLLDAPGSPARAAAYSLADLTVIDLGLAHLLGD